MTEAQPVLDRFYVATLTAYEPSLEEAEAHAVSAFRRRAAEEEGLKFGPISRDLVEEQRMQADHPKAVVRVYTADRIIGVGSEP